VLSERGFAEDPALPTIKDIVRLRKLYEEEKETKEATILAVVRAEKSSATTADEPWPPATEKPSGITVEKETFGEWSQEFEAWGENEPEGESIRELGDNCGGPSRRLRRRPARALCLPAPSPEPSRPAAAGGGVGRAAGRYGQHAD